MAKTYTLVIQVETEPVGLAVCAEPSDIARAVMDRIPLGERVSGEKIKGCTCLASGKRKGYMSGVGS